MPGTTGWSSTFAGRPALLWQPQVISGPTFGVQADGFGFTITGADGMGVMVEASRDTGSSSWASLKTITLTGGSADFRDPGWKDQPARFYRLRMP